MKETVKQKRVIINPPNGKPTIEGNTMLTVTIKSIDDTHISVREWPSVDVIKKGSARFDQEMDLEAERFELEMGMTTDEAYKLAESYKAVLKSVCGELVYYMARDEQAYVTNSSGKTVAVVK